MLASYKKRKLQPLNPSSIPLPPLSLLPPPQLHLRRLLPLLAPGSTGCSSRVSAAPSLIPSQFPSSRIPHTPASPQAAIALAQSRSRALLIRTVLPSRSREDWGVTPSPRLELQFRPPSSACRGSWPPLNCSRGRDPDPTVAVQLSCAEPPAWSCLLRRRAVQQY
jgi:hypothetical protein